MISEKKSFRMHPIFTSNEREMKGVLSRNPCRDMSPGTKAILVKAMP